jgi:hypothetical protein
MKKTLLLVATACVAGCATIVESPFQTVRVDVHPTNGICIISRDGNQLAVSTPDNRMVRLGKAFTGVELHCSAPGHVDTVEKLPTSLSPYTVASFLLVDFGIVDAVSGAAWRYPERVTVLLQPKGK